MEGSGVGLGKPRRERRAPERYDNDDYPDDYTPDPLENGADYSPESFFDDDDDDECDVGPSGFAGLCAIFDKQDEDFAEKKAKASAETMVALQAAQDAGCEESLHLLPICPGCNSRKSTKEYGFCRKCRQDCQKRALSGDVAAAQVFEALQQRKKIYDRKRVALQRQKIRTANILDVLAVGKKKKAAANFEEIAAGFSRMQKRIEAASVASSQPSEPIVGNTSADTTMRDDPSSNTMSDEDVKALASTLGQTSVGAPADNPPWKP